MRRKANVRKGERGHDANGHVKNSAANRCAFFFHAVYPRREMSVVGFRLYHDAVLTSS